MSWKEFKNTAESGIHEMQTAIRDDDKASYDHARDAVTLAALVEIVGNLDSIAVALRELNERSKNRAAAPGRNPGNRS